MFNKLLICGCARSGNSLMLHLMGSGFRNIKMVYDGPGGEVVPTDNDIENKKTVVVGKFPKKLGKIQKFIDKNFGIIFMIRHPYDVLTSKHHLKPDKYWVQPDRWISSAQDILKYKDHNNCLLVKYELLISKPEIVQKKISDKFQLLVKTKFQECPNSFDQEDKVNMLNMNGFRSLDPSRIGNWKQDPEKITHIKKVIDRHPDILTWMKEFQYSTSL